MRATAIIVAMIASTSLILPGSARAEPGNWSQRTAYVLPAGRAEFLALGPSRYAPRERLEVGLHLGVMLIAPNLQLKLAWHNQGQTAVASRHRLWLPGVLREAPRLGATLGTSRWLSERVSDHDLLLTRRDGQGLTTFQLGAALAFGYAPSSSSHALLDVRAPPRFEGSEQGGAAARVVARGGAMRRRYIGTGGYFAQYEAQLHLRPSSTATWLELEGALGLERRHLFAQFGARSSFDGRRLSALPWVELGLAIE